MTSQNNSTRGTTFTNNLPARKQSHYELSTQIARLSDKVLIRKVRKSGKGDSSWGVSHAMNLGAHKVFVKRIPVTELELTDPYSTRNHYQLPL